MTRYLLLLVISSGLVACAVPKVHQSPGASVLDPASRDILTGQVPVTDTGMDQITPDNTGNTQEQIAALSAYEAITADQLRTYIDRCAPGMSEVATEDVYCDELRLMIKRRFKSEDDLNRALNVLDNLGRGGEADILLDPAGPTGQLPPDVLQVPASTPATKNVPKDTVGADIPNAILLEKPGG